MCHVYKQLVKPDTWFKYDLEVRDDIWRGKKMTPDQGQRDGNELWSTWISANVQEDTSPFSNTIGKVSIRKVEVLPLAD